MPVVAYALDGGQLRTLDGCAAITAALKDERLRVWIDLDERNPTIEAFLTDTLHISPLVVDDIFSDRVHPKVEDHGAYLYLIVHGVRRDAEEPTDLGTIELDLVLGPRWVVTHHTAPLRSIEQFTEDLKRNPWPLERGSAFVAHAIIDRMTDHYLPVVDRFEEEIDEIEVKVVTDPKPYLLQQLFGMKRSLQQLRRISTYQRDMLQRLSRHEFSQIPEAAGPFFRDVYDHFVRIADLADSYRELVTVALEIYMSVMANRQNEVMKALALLSTVMLPLNFIAGVYGMNFDHMPLLHHPLGLPITLGVMVITALVLAWTFKRRRWL
jgi:magnesium transporter